jgi:hypothetical protein
MQIKADKITNILGILGAILIIQQTYFPELIPKEYTTPILAGIVSVFGIATNKRKVTIWFNGGNGQTDKTIDEIEREIERACQEIEELVERAERVCGARRRGKKSEQ